MPSIALFTPGTTVNVVASATSTSVTLATGAGASVSIKNISATSNAFVTFGTAAVVTTAASGMVVGPGERLGVTIDPNTQTTVAVVAVVTAQLYFTRGEGV